MIIAISAINKQEDSLMDPRFGRARYIYIYNTETKKGKFFNNEENINAAHGAGTQAAGLLIGENVEVLITGHVGPKAFEVLNDVHIKMFHGDENKTISENILNFLDNSLTQITTAGESRHGGHQ